jgi:hypothetical protein
LSQISLLGCVVATACVACNATPARSHAPVAAATLDAGMWEAGAVGADSSAIGSADGMTGDVAPAAGGSPDAGPLGADSGESGPNDAAEGGAGLAETEAGSDATAADGGGCAGAIVCDDFERYAVGAAPGAPWQVATTSGTVTVDSTRASSGNKSIKVVAPVSTGYRSAMLRLTGAGLPTSTNVVYGRMMFWLDSAPPTSVHWTFIDGSGLVPGMNYHSVYRYGGQLPIPLADGGTGSQLMASYDTVDSYTGVGPSSDCWHHSHARAVPIGEWTCAEWEFDGPNDTLRFWINGNSAPDLTVASTGDGCISQPATYVWTAPSFQQIDVGWESYQADAARTIWIDDVAIGAAPIGCP